MTNAVLIFTFSPVQSFIGEARRAGDLFVGSKILSELAKATARSIGEGNLVYPVSLDSDAPNVIVARVPSTEARQIAEVAKQALLTCWHSIAGTAKARFARDADLTFDRIWARQIDHLWEVLWAAAEESAGYGEAYERARDALDATKRSRLFDACDEPGVKDTLSGQREALHHANQTSYSAVKDFWKAVSTDQRIGQSRLRPEGRERLDAIGATKRFCDLADQQFPSVSTIAALDFIGQAKMNALKALRGYRDAARALLSSKGYQPRGSVDPDWPFDGDLLFEETLAPERLKDGYGLDQPDARALAEARAALKALHKASGGPPSPYYAILVLDGDSMGQRIADCLTQPDPHLAHRALSRSLATFSQHVGRIMPTECLIYNGGDDVLAFLPLSQAVGVARQLADTFRAITGGTASAGIAIAHHLHPLDSTLAAARAAEKQAKKVDGKDAVCISVLKRSGEEVTARSKWVSLELLESLVSLLVDGSLSSRFVYDAISSLRALPISTEFGTDLLQAELRRQVSRHRDDQRTNPPSPDEWAEWLTAWSKTLPGGADELGSWLSIARFAARETKGDGT